MEIGWFQLENLFLSRNLFFTLLDLRADPKLTGEADFDHVLKTAHKLKAEDIENQLAKLAVPKQYPIVLICEDGRRSKKAAQRLEKQGYAQVYILGAADAFSSL